MTRTSVLAFVALALAPGPLWAAPGPQDPPDRGRNTDDGRPVTSARKRSLEQYDANRNGKLDPEEKDRMREDLQGRMKTLKAQVNARYDKNKNGVIEPEEEKLIREDREKHKVFKGAALRRYDKDGSGDLDEQERKTMSEERDAFVRRIREQVLRHYDLNRNGRLDPDEQALMQERTRALGLKDPQP